MRQAQGLLYVRASGESMVLAPKLLGTGTSWDEARLRDLIFAHPAILPLREIDPRAGTPVPLCTEMRCGAGRIDCVFCDAFGHLTLVECKLWRNPEARRKVVAQILDYAAEMRGWTTADIEREVNARTGRVEALFARVGGADQGEAAFNDAVARNLREGRFTLLVVGDGIREEAERLTAFLTRDVSLRFALALVEVKPHELPNGDVIVAATPVVRTREIERLVLAVTGDTSTGETALVDQTEQRRTMSEAVRQKDRAFWGPLLSSLRLDDPEQEIPASGNIENKRFRLPGGAWLTAYRYRAGNRIGVALVLPSNDQGDAIAETLLRERSAISSELPASETVLQPENRWIWRTDAGFPDVQDESTWEDQKQFFTRTINAYVNAFRPRLQRFLRDHAP